MTSIANLIRKVIGSLTESAGLFIFVIGTERETDRQTETEGVRGRRGEGREKECKIEGRIV